MILSKQKGSFSSKQDNRMEIEAPDFSPLPKEDDEPQVDIFTVLTNLVAIEMKRKGIKPSTNEKADLLIQNQLKKVSESKLTDKKILECELDLKNQRIVKADADRSRIQKIRVVWKAKDPEEGGDIHNLREQIDEQIKGHIEKLLTYYTK